MDLIKRLLQNSGNFKYCLRQAFRGSLNVQSFNWDDVIAFFKSPLQTSVDTVSVVLKEEGIKTEALEAFVQNINVNNNFEGSVGTVVGNVEGNVNGTSHSSL